VPQAPRTDSPPLLDCDVLVLGAGLAGMRAAWAAQEADARLRVVLVSPRKAPAGSSFANRNNALGMQAPHEHEAEAFVAEVLRLAPPGLALPELARALAADAPARLRDLLGLNLSFRREVGGALARFPGCFSPSVRAVVFEHLAEAHAAFLAKVRGLGVRMLHGFEAVELLGGHAAGQGVRRIHGARLAALRGGESLTVTARAVVAALGGPAPLYARRICGSGGSALAYGLLAQAGARLVNTRFLQFFWSRADDLCFMNPGDLPWPAELRGLAAQRRTHCPLGFGLADAVLDQALLDRADAQGLVRLPGQPPMLLAAHAGNGGAVIDGEGRTTAPGLLACGECAGGMHGANRMGGAMVLSALVFGARAGTAAAREAAERTGTCGGAGGTRLGRGTRTPHEAADAVFLRRLRRGMQRHGLPGRKPSEEFLDWLADAADASAPQRQRLLAASALAVLGQEPFPS